MHPSIPSHRDARPLILTHGGADRPSFVGMGSLVLWHGEIEKFIANM